MKSQGTVSYIQYVIVEAKTTKSHRPVTVYGSLVFQFCEAIFMHVVTDPADYRF